MSNGLRDMLYTQPATPGAAASGYGINAGFGIDLGNETFRVQLAIAGLFLVALAAIVYAHKSGYRFSVKVD